MIEFVNVNKFYGDFHALKNLNLRFSKGEVVVVIGPSGSGKSTMLRCINGLESINEGQLAIRLDEDIVAEPKEMKHRIGMVFQHFHLYPHKTVLENIILAPMKVLGKSREEAEIEAIKLLTKVQLADKRDSYPHQLSGGQQQRIAIARSLAMRPDVLLFDEPTSALDPETIGEVLDVMRSLAQEGMTMIIVTHEMGFARTVADRVVFMDQGQVKEDRPSREFFEKPFNQRAQQFVSQIVAY